MDIPDCIPDGRCDPVVEKKRVFNSKEKYYQSPEWATVRAFALNRAGRRCQHCGSYRVVLQVHHKTYAILFNEKPQDLEVLCKICHDKADRQRAAASRYNKGFKTFMQKKHGEDYEVCPGDHEDFDRWLESKRY